MGLKPGVEKPVELTAEILANKYPLIQAEVSANAIATVTQDMDAKLEAATDAGYNRGLAVGTIKGATDERERIMSVQAKSYPGLGKECEAMINARSFDGKSTGPEVAEAILESMKAKNAKMFKAMKDEAPAPVDTENENEDDDEEDEDVTAGVKNPLKAAWDKGPLSARLKKEFGGDWDSYKAYYEKHDEHYIETKHVTI